jgi:hypothetical protein
MIAGFERRNTGADFFDDTDPFMTEHTAGYAGRHVAFENMEVGPTDGGMRDPDKRIPGALDHRPDALFKPLLARAVIDKGSHRRSPWSFTKLIPENAVPAH